MYLLGTLYDIQSTFVVHSTVSNEQLVVYNIQLQCTIYSVQCLIYIVQCTIYNDSVLYTV